jgi:hypothetical protein
MATRSSALLALIAASWCATACVEPNPPGTGDSSDLGVVEATIDPDAFLELAPGEGVLIGIEYTSGGTWKVSTVCDTTYSGAPCWFDIIVDSYSPSGIRDVAPEELESNDEIYRLDPFALELDFLTGDSTDSVRFATTPGSTLRVTAALHEAGGNYWGDWRLDPRLVSWVGDGGINWGAPTNPLDLTPATP